MVSNAATNPAAPYPQRKPLPLKKLKVQHPTRWQMVRVVRAANQKASCSAMHFNLACNSHKTKEECTHKETRARRQYINKYLNKYLQLWRGIISSARKYALQK